LKKLLSKCHAHAEQCNEEDLRAARTRIEILRDRIKEVEDDTNFERGENEAIDEYTQGLEKLIARYQKRTATTQANPLGQRHSF
jgi:hypothetical protein